MISKGKKDVAVVMAAGGFMKATVPFLVFYFSAQILNNAIEGDYAYIYNKVIREQG